jgi:hypothetical protein
MRGRGCQDAGFCTKTLEAWGKAYRLFMNEMLPEIFDPAPPNSPINTVLRLREEPNAEEEEDEDDKKQDETDDDNGDGYSE